MKAADLPVQASSTSAAVEFALYSRFKFVKYMIVGRR
jgi:hypothetical protein